MRSGAKIKVMLDQAGVSVSSFARMIGMNQSTLHRIASGEVGLESVSVGNFLKIAHGLGLSAEELYYDDPHYRSDKVEIDTVFAAVNEAGRMALLACARGIGDTFPAEEEHFLPDLRGELPDFSVI